MNCPRCKATIGPLANPDGIVTCPSCGSKLMTRAAALRSQGGTRPSEPKKTVADLPPEATMPPTPASSLGLGAMWQTETVALPPEPAKAKAGPPPPAVPPAAPVVAPPTAAPAAPPPEPELLHTLLGEVRAVRAVQERILEILERRGTEAPESRGQDESGEQAIVSPIRARKAKTVVLIDDDPETRAAALKELQQVDVPTRAYGDGNSAIAAIAAEKPDVIALEIGLGGEMSGKDVINMIKATMEWVDIPIVLWTREPIANQREARQIHGADELVSKGHGTAPLVARIITLFRRAH